MNRYNTKEDISWRGILLRAALIIGAVALIAWAMPRDSRSFFRVEQGKPWIYAEFTAPFDFPIYKSDEAIKRERDSLLRQYEPYYNYNKDTEGIMVRKFAADYADGIPGISREYVSLISNRLHRLYQQGIMSPTDHGTLLKDTAQMIRIVSGKNAVSVGITRIFSTKTAYEELFADERIAAERQVLQRCNLNDYITPNLTFDRDRSEASKNDLLSSIPLASGIVQKGQKIIDRGEIVSEHTYHIIESFKRENELRNANETQTQLTIFGQLLYVSLLIIGFTLYLSLFRRDYFEQTRSMAMLYSLIIIFALLTTLLMRNILFHVYLLPYAMVPIIIRIFMDSRTAFTAHYIMVLICAVMLQHPFEFIILQTIAGLAAIYSLRELSQRSQLFKTAVIVAVASMATQLASDWMHADALTAIDYSIYNYIIMSGILLLFVYPLLYLIEKVFGFTSDITLIELSNTNNELLRKMSEVAPGTFQHSIQVGNLAAEIANKIGAKAQLVRTGALYHDIGKTLQPIYFTENQSGFNPHDALTPIESAQIIISHVTEGVKLAEKYNLPDVITSFIQTHHGQGKAKYFFLRYQQEHPDETVDPIHFTYPGPNPFTREQAILMMADTVEAASRSLPDYTEQSIRELVNRLIDAQVADGYFRECPITFRDIQYAKTVLIEKLKTIYHTRISYPDEKKKK